MASGRIAFAASICNPGVIILTPAQHEKYFGVLTKHWQRRAQVLEDHGMLQWQLPLSRLMHNLFKWMACVTKCYDSKENQPVAR